MALTEVYEVATFYAHFDVVKEGETPPPPVTVRVCDSLSCAMAGAEKLLEGLPGKLGRMCASCARRAWARAIVRRLCGRSCADVQGQPSTSVTAAVKAKPHAHAWKPTTDFAAYQKAGGYSLLEGLSCRQAHARRTDQDRQRCRPARPWRRRLSDRTQMVAGARRTRAAPVRGQCRRRRARHIQGSPLSRARSASFPRRHVDRRVGGRGAPKPTSTSATNIPNCA